MLFQELGKLRRSSFMSAIILAAVGMIMILCPPQYINALVSVLGYVMLIGATVLVLEFMSGNKSLFAYVRFTLALIMALLGVAVLVIDNMVLVIGIVFGLYLVGYGLVTATNAWLYARRAQRSDWWVLFVLSLVLIALGVLLLINPWWNEPTRLFNAIGCMMLYSAGVSIVRLICLWPVKGTKED